MPKNTKNLAVETLSIDILIIGAGGAGLRAAIEAHNAGAKVLVVSKEDLGGAHTNKAMGGLNVAIKAPATPEQHYNDTVNGGWHLNNHTLAKIFSEEMPERIYDLERYGVKFDRLPDGSFYTWAGGKQSAPLNLCAGDYTGREIMNGLVAEIKRLKISYLDNHFVTKLYKEGKKVVGAHVMDMKTGKFQIVNAKATIMATGGLGMLYETNSNDESNTGEGFALALDVGANLSDMEMIQFHPTGMAWPQSVRGKLITEKVRGHGGKLLNKNGERFMTCYQPQRMELAGRDEVTRAIYQEIKEGRGTEHSAVYLDVTHWAQNDAEKLVPDVLQNHLEIGVDIRRQKMEITPTMHYVMGGIRITEWGETNVPGLYAAGEVTSSIHGANRLGGNSLGETQVFGRRVGIRASEDVKKQKPAIIPENHIAKELKRISEIQARKKGPKPEEVMKKLKKVMWDKAGIVKNEKLLKEGLRDVKALEKDSTKVIVQSLKDLQQSFELDRMLETAETIIVSAILRRESRGAHFREDYPKMDDSWEKNIYTYKDSTGKLKTKIMPVVRDYSPTKIKGRIVLENKVIKGIIDIQDGKITKIHSGWTGKADLDYSRDGLYIMPGLLEVHGHMREPGLETKEDIPHGTRAALAGGYTTIFDMPNTKPPITTALQVDEQIKRYSEKSFTDFIVNMGTSITDIDELKKIDPEKIAAVKIFTAGHATTPTTVSSLEVLAQIFEILAGRNIIAMVHAEQQELINFFTKKFRYELKRNDPEAWSEARNVSVVLTSVLEMISMAYYLKTKLYLVHLSTVEEFDAVRFGKKLGVDLHGEMMAHELTFTTDDYKKYGNLVNIAPPIRPPANQKELWRLLREGSVDVICAEHAPHELAEKQKNVWEAASGLPSVQESLPALVTGWVKNFGKKTLEEGLVRISQVTSINTAEIFDLPKKGGIKEGKDADLTVIDTKTHWKVKKDDLFTKNKWSAYEGMDLIGRPVATYLRGQLMYEKGKVVGKQGYGKMVQHK